MRGEKNRIAPRATSSWHPSALRRAELAPVDAALVGHRRGGLLQSADRLAADRFEAGAPEIALEREALGDRSALRQHPVEFEIAPERGKVDEIVQVEIGVDQSGQGSERKIVPVDRMGDEQRIAGW